MHGLKKSQVAISTDDVKGCLRRPLSLKSNVVWLKYRKKVIYLGVTTADRISLYLNLIELKARFTESMYKFMYIFIMEGIPRGCLVCSIIIERP